MANIQNRPRKNGEDSFTIRIRIKNQKTFSITFNSLIDAQLWLEQNENKYSKNPKKYHDWLLLRRKKNMNILLILLNK